jgi:heterodisulfide reductase subunit A
VAKAGINPYLMQMANVREQVAWVPADPEWATENTVQYIRAATRRVPLQPPLQEREIEVCPGVLVVGAGPAGLKAAMALAEAGRQVPVVEKTPVEGGLPVRFEELFPNLECGPCLLEPVEADMVVRQVPGLTGCEKTRGGGGHPGVWKFRDMACIGKMR